jgi:hypothetical protein
MRTTRYLIWVGALTVIVFSEFSITLLQAPISSAASAAELETGAFLSGARQCPVVAPSGWSVLEVLRALSSAVVHVAEVPWVLSQLQVLQCRLLVEVSSTT